MLEREIDDLRRDKTNLRKELDDVLLNSKQEEEIKQCKTQIVTAVAEKEKMQVERDKVLVAMQKIELEHSKDLFVIEKEKNNVKEECRVFQSKLNEAVKEKTNLAKDLEQVREQCQNSNNLVDKVLSEKKVLINDYQTIKTEMFNMKEHYDKQSNILV